METRANYVLIGLFTLAVIVGAFSFVYWFSNNSGPGVRTAYRVVFQGPIAGLRTGAAVMFNGIRVGEVTSLGLDPNDPKQALATISVDMNTPVRADSQVSLDFQGLTGIAALALKGGTMAAGPLKAKDGEEMPVLVADASATQELTQSARDVLARLNHFLESNEQSLKNSIKNIETVTETVARNSDKIEDSIKSIQSFAETLSRNSERVDRIMAGMENVIGGPDGKGEVPAAVRAIRVTAENLDKRIDVLINDGRRTLATIDRTINNFDKNPQRILFGGGGGSSSSSTPAAAPEPPPTIAATPPAPRAPRPPRPAPAPAATATGTTASTPAPTPMPRQRQGAAGAATAQ